MPWYSWLEVYYPNGSSHLSISLLQALSSLKHSKSLQEFVLTNLEKKGLYPKALVCDQGSNNHSFLHKLEKVSIEKPHIVQNNQKVFVIYDPPHLLKNIRNNFMKSNYKYDSMEVKWEYIVDFTTKTKPCRLEWLQI